MPITHHVHHRNFITKIVSYPKICSVANSMTVLPDMLPVILDMMRNKLTGTYNMVNQGTITHNEVLNMYKDFVVPNILCTNMTIEEQNNMLKSQRSNCQLDTSKLYNLYPIISDIHTSVRRRIEKIK